MASPNIMPSLFTRLLRPFSTSSSLPLTSGESGTPLPPNAALCTIAAGCFWGVEKIFRKHFGAQLLDTKVGYIGGDASHPSYRAVCTGRTGHAEALQMAFDPEKTSYASLIEFFYRMHDPTTKDRQGADAGTQYRSGIFFHDADQERVAKEVTEKVQKQWWKAPITTDIVPAGTWWNAEDYHQLYLDKNPSGYECPAHYVRKFKDLE